MKQIWNKRYASNEYAYGIEPNVFFKEKIDNMKTGRILLPAEGEGRNAVYAAKLGWDVYAFDFSSAARYKAQKLSKKNNVDIVYNIHELKDADYEQESFDVVALIYAHNPDRKENHQHLMKFLKPGGLVIIEAFSKNQINNNSSGPKDVNMLYSIEELEADFIQFSKVDVWVDEVELNEGVFHKGKSSIIRLAGIK